MKDFHKKIASLLLDGASYALFLEEVPLLRAQQMPTLPSTNFAIYAEVVPLEGLQIYETASDMHKDTYDEEPEKLVKHPIKELKIKLPTLHGLKTYRINNIPRPTWYGIKEVGIPILVVAGFLSSIATNKVGYENAARADNLFTLALCLQYIKHRVQYGTP